VQVSFKNILFLTDFSAPSEAALPFASAIGRGYGSRIFTLNVFVPPAYTYTTPESSALAIEAEEEQAKANLQRVESQFVGVEHECILEQGVAVWDAVKRTIECRAIDLIVLGTHGRTGAEKLLLGSVAEEIFRRSPVPVLTVGPRVRTSSHNAGQFHRILLATDFTTASIAGAPFALSLARETHSSLVLLHVMARPAPRHVSKPERSVAEAMQKIHDTVGSIEGVRGFPEAVVEFGEPGERIVAAAGERRADLIVMGIRDADGPIEATTHFRRTTAHNVVAHASCPVLTVRSPK
jgi:nucleotide-binding universal stress UspA family protein